MSSESTHPPSSSSSPPPSAVARLVEEEMIDLKASVPSPYNEDIQAIPIGTPNEDETAAEEVEGEGEENGIVLLRSVTRLRGLSFALSDFTRSFRDMENHLKKIQMSILEKSKEVDSMQAQMREDPPLRNQQEPPQPEKEVDAPLENQQDHQQPQKEDDPPLENQQEPLQPQKTEDPPLENQQERQQPQKKEDPPFENRQEPLQPQKKEDPPLENQQEPIQPQKKEDPPLENQREPRQTQKKEDPLLENQRKFQQSQKKEDPPLQNQQETVRCLKKEDPPLQNQQEPQQSQKKDDPPHQNEEKPHQQQTNECLPHQNQEKLHQQQKKEDPQHQNQGEPKQQYKKEDPCPVSRALQSICSSMSSKGLNKYVSARMDSDIGLLRDEVSEALKLAPDPARLVLNSMGRLYLQGGSAFVHKRATDFAALNLRIFVLECFILSGCSKIELSVKREAEKVAVVWRNRLVKEGGVGSASCEEALALLLFIAAFGIPSEFKPSDVCKLVRMSNLQQKADVLHRSPLFLGKFRDFIQGLVDKGLHVLAVDLSCALESPPKYLLSSFSTTADKSSGNMRRRNLEMNEKLNEIYKLEGATLNSVMQDNKLSSGDIDMKEDATKLEKRLTGIVEKSNEEALTKRKEIQQGSFDNETKSKRHQPTTERVVSHTPPSVPQKSNEEAVPKGQEIQHGSYEDESQANRHQLITERVVSHPLPSVPQKSNEEAVPKGKEIQHGSFEDETKGNRQQPTTERVVSQPPPSVPQKSNEETFSKRKEVEHGPFEDEIKAKRHHPITTTERVIIQPPPLPLKNNEAVPSRGEIQHGSFKANRQQRTTERIFIQSTPSLAQPQVQHSNGLPAQIMCNGGGPQASLNGFPSAVQSERSGGLLWTGNALGAVAGNSAGTASAGAARLTPRGSAPSMGSGMGPLWSGSTLGAAARTSAGPAAASGLAMPSHAGPSIGRGFDPSIGYGNGMPIGMGAGPGFVTPSHVVPSFGSGFDPSIGYGNGMPIGLGFPPLARQRPVGPPSQSKLDSFPGRLDRGSGSESFPGRLDRGSGSDSFPGRLDRGSGSDNFPGRLDRGSGSSNLFQFVDTVLQGESSHHHNSSHVGNTAPAASSSAHNTSFY